MQDITSGSRATSAHSQFSQNPVSDKEIDLLELERDARDITRVLSAKSPNFGKVRFWSLDEVVGDLSIHVRPSRGCSKTVHYFF